MSASSVSGNADEKGTQHAVIDARETGLEHHTTLDNAEAGPKKADNEKATVQPCDLETTSAGDEGSTTLADPVAPGTEDALNSEEEETPEYPSGLKLALLTFGLCMATFTVALDNTIIATVYMLRPCTA